MEESIPLLNMNSIKYFEGYKYLTNTLYTMQLDFAPEVDLITSFGEFRADGWVIIYKDYASDGPSGPTYDTKNSMRGAFVHDFMYQLLRMEMLPKNFRKKADNLLYDMLRQDGMNYFRAQYWFWGLRVGGKGAANPKSSKEVLSAP